ncbi:MAG: T9SS type A sorting domain-containing protein [Bacteroidales bacterium]|nr:T9SS type A sorting domain-containing protein [Bacteroidales bacterium]
MDKLYQMLALFLLLAVAGGQLGFAQDVNTETIPPVSESTICESALPFTWNDVIFTAAGDSTITLVSSAGADSMVTMRLYITKTDTVHLFDTLCAGETFDSLGFNIVANIDIDTATTFSSAITACDSVTILHLTVHQPSYSTYSHDACDSFTWIDGVTYTESTNTPTITLTNAAGCDSVVTLNLTINPTYFFETDAAICAGDTFSWQRNSYMTEGVYWDSLQTAAGCDSIYKLHLTVNPLPVVTIIATADTVCGGEVVLMANGNTNYSYQWSNGSSNSWISVDSTGSYSVTATDPNECSNTVSKAITVNQPCHTMIDTTICQGESFDFFGESKTSTGVYVNTATATNGCDSIVTLVLAVNPAYYITRTVTICEGESHLFNGELLTQGGTYYDSLETVNGCDSIIELKLTVNPLPKINVVAAPDSIVCEGGSITLIAEVEKTGTYLWNTGETERKITGINSTGTYTVTFTETATGCKNTASKKVIVNPVTYGDTTAVACESFTWYGIEYSSTPEIAPTHTFKNHNDCDSVVTLHLTILHGTHRVFVDTTCESYTWHGIKYDTTGIYIHSDTNADGCLNVDTLHLTIYKPIHQSYTITECESYVWEDGDGHEYTASGTYTYAHEDEHGCWQVDTLHLTINHPTNTAVTVSTCESYYWAANGLTYTTSGNYYYSHEGSNECTQVDTLHLTIKNPTHTSISQSACNSFTWNNTTYTESGDYVQTFQSANGCDSVVTLHLTLYHDTATSWSATGCESFVWNDSTYTESDTYVQYFKTVHGCDSVVTLNLTILHGTHNVEFKTVCESYTWHGTTYTISGTYLYPYTNAAGCASVDTLHLTVNYGTHNVEFGFACESYEWHGAIYTTSGTYTYAYNNADGCPSVDTLHLTVNYGTHNVETETVCESYTWHGTTYTTSGTYTYAYNNADGCPSVDTLKLTVNYGTHNVQIETACESYTWHGTTYTISGTYLYPYTNAAGCASVDTLHLTVNYGTHNVEFGFACESYEWHGVIYTTSGTYTYAYNNADGCASVDTLHLTVNYGTHNVETETVCESYTWHGTTYTTSGTYTYAYNNADGCPSVDTLKLTVNYGTHNVINETACESYTWYGVTYTVSDIYTHSYTNTYGCASVDTLHLTINNPTHTAIRVDTCDNFTWLNGTGQNYTTTGTYTYAHIDANGCTQVDTLYLTIYPLPIPLITGDNTFCPDEVATLVAGGGTDYVWSTGETTNQIQVGTPDTYTVTVTDAYGCSADASFTVTYAPMSLEQLPIVAKRHADGTPYMLVYPQAGLRYQWYKGGDPIPGATQQYYAPDGGLLPNTSYKVHVAPMDPDSCGLFSDEWTYSGTASTKVRILPNPNNGRFKLLLPEGTVDVQILNANGQLVLSRKTDGATELEMDTGLANGLYFVKTFRKNGSSNVEKLIINR